MSPTHTDIYYHYDILSNVVALTHTNGSVEAQYDMEAFGNVLSGSVNARHLTAMVYDQDAGLYCIGERWYDPTVGLWMEVEPTGSDGPNTYWYVMNNPANWHDLNGLSTAAPVSIPFPRPPIFFPGANVGAKMVGKCCGPIVGAFTTGLEIGRCIDTVFVEPLQRAKPRKRRRFSCVAKCHVIDDTSGVAASIGYMTGHGAGHSEAEACESAKSDVDSKLSLNHHKRHCKCSCKKR